MAIISNGLHGDARKRVGNIVYRKWRDLNVAAKYQPEVNNPKTSSQQSVRARFAGISKIAAELGAALVLGFKNFCAGTKVPPRSQFIKMNWHNTADSPFTFAFDNAIISQGPIAAPNAELKNVQAAGSVTVTIKDSDEQFAYGSDELYIVLYNNVKKKSLMPMATSRDMGDDYVIPVPTTWQGDKVHVWAFCISVGHVFDDGSVVVQQRKGDASDSIYLGMVNIS